MNVLYSSLSTFKVQTKRRLIRVKTAERVRQVTVGSDGTGLMCVQLRTAVWHVGLGTRLCELQCVAAVFVRAS